MVPRMIGKYCTVLSTAIQYRKVNFTHSSELVLQDRLIITVANTLFGVLLLFRLCCLHGKYIYSLTLYRILCIKVVQNDPCLKAYTANALKTGIIGMDLLVR